MSPDPLPEELLELALGTDADAARREAARRDPEHGAAFREYEAWVARLRAVCATHTGASTDAASAPGETARIAGEPAGAPPRSAAAPGEFAAARGESAAARGKRAAARGERAAARGERAAARVEFSGARGAGAEEDSLVASILARTTREDLGWRGDVGLLRTFVDARWRSSAALRLAAASMLLHLLALPVLAFLVLREEPRPSSFRTGIEVPREGLPLPPAPADEPVRELEYPGGVRTDGWLLGQGVDPLARENARRLARLSLESEPGPGVSYPDAEVPADRVEALLEARARLLAGRDVVLPPASAETDDADALERALRLEVELDLWLTNRGPAPALSAPDADLPQGPGGRLLAAARERARTCGLAPAGEAQDASDAARDPAAWAADLRDALRGREGRAARRWFQWASERAAR